MTAHSSFLNEGLRIGKPLEDKGMEDLSNLYNNLGQTYYYLKNYDKSIVYFAAITSVIFPTGGSTAKPPFGLMSLTWQTPTPRRACSIRPENMLSLAIDLADQLNSRGKQSDTYQILSKLAQRRGDYKKAYDYQTKWYDLDTAIVNGEAYKAVAELEKKYEARQHENEMLLLQGEITQQKFHTRIMLILSISLLLIAILAAPGLCHQRKVNRKLQATNDLVTRQNERLSELNYEKNSLISIVSHDLSTPFASIGMWASCCRWMPATLRETRKKRSAASSRPRPTGKSSSVISLTWKKSRPTSISCNWRILTAHLLRIRH